MIPMIADLIVSLVGEEGALAPLLEKIGLQQGKKLASTAMTKAPEATEAAQPAAIRGKGMMYHWLPEWQEYQQSLPGGLGQQARVPQAATGNMSTEDIVNSIKGTASQQVAGLAGAAMPAPLPGGQTQVGSQAANKQLAQQQQSNQLQQKAIQNQQKANQQQGQWLTGTQKTILLTNMLNYAFYRLVDTVNGSKIGNLKDWIFHPIRKSLESLVKLATGYVTITNKLAEFSQQISDNNRELALWNGTLSASFAQLDFKRQELKIQQGQATVGSAVMLNESIGELLQSVQPITSGVATIVNLVGTGAAMVSKFMVEFAKLHPLLKPILGILDNIEKELKDKPRIGGDDKGRAALSDLRNLLPGRDPGIRPADLGGAVPRQPLAPLIPRKGK